MPLFDLDVLLLSYKTIETQGMGTVVRRDAPNGEVPSPLRSFCVFVENKQRAAPETGTALCASAMAYLPMALRFSSAGSPMMALIRRTPAEELSSFRILKATSSEVLLACGPPQTSLEKSPIV